MKPEVWGPHAWIFLHSITLEYPNNPSSDDKLNVKNFMNSLGKVIPCQKCKVNFNNHLEKNPLTDEILMSKSNLVKWLIDIHNSVNKMNNKKEMTYEESLKNLLLLYNSSGTSNMLITCILMLIVIVAIFIYLLKIL